MPTSLIRHLRSVHGRWRALRAMERTHPGLRIGEGVEIRSPDRLSVGTDVVIDAGAVLHCGGMAWAPGGGITIGDRSYVGPRCVLFGAGEIRIGSDVLLSPGVVVTSHQHTFAETEPTIREQPIEFAPVEIGDDVWIGANAVILPGVRLGRGTVVGAGAVVTRDAPPGSVLLGVPARVARER